MTREPSIKKPPFDIPPATRDENAPKSLPIRVHAPDKAKFRRRQDMSAEEAHAKRIARTAHLFDLGYSVDINNIPLDKLFR